MTTRNPQNADVQASLEILLDGLGITVDELDARRPNLSSDERRAWLLADTLRQDGVLQD